MKIAVLSYSLTGNNEALARSIAEELTAEHIKITEPATRTMGSIVIDMLLKKTPQVQPSPDKLKDYDLVLVMGPIWMGQIATPLRSYLSYLKTKQLKYAFISISGGADGTNPKLQGELKKRVGREPIALIDLHIADLLPAGSQAVRKDTSAYRLTNEDVKKLTHTAVTAVNKTNNF